jgi:hypothetical protein
LHGRKEQRDFTRSIVRYPDGSLIIGQQVIDNSKTHPLNNPQGHLRGDAAWIKEELAIGRRALHMMSMFVIGVHCLGAGEIPGHILTIGDPLISEELANQPGRCRLTFLDLFRREQNVVGMVLW